MSGIRMPGDLTAVLLTHRHSDHAGNAAWLRKRFGARVICHENDAAALSGQVSAPPLVRKDPEQISQFGKQRFYDRWLCAYEDRAPALCEVDELYDEGAWKWGFRIVPVPGHTEGSVMLYHEPSRTLFSGDAILVGNKLTRISGAGKDRSLHLAESAYSQDAPSCHLAVKRFLRHLPPVDVLCSGHGPALDETTQARLEKLLKA
jgi:glyoxylase-like metal-dependent hydrolase (beta-lactamase superfamily II)